MSGLFQLTGGSRAGVASVLPFILTAAGLTAAPQEDSFSISVDVNLVVLHASVHDSQGQDVLNLGQSDFALYEDGVRQTIRIFRREDAPVTIGLVVDHSGSMGPKLGDVTAAARLFAQSSNPKDELFVVNFNEKVFFGLAAGQQFTDQPTLLEAAIARAPAAGQTALYDAIAAGLEHLQTGHWDKKVLIVISDGGDNASTSKLARVIDMAERSNAVIYAVGIFGEDDPDANPGVLRRLADTTGGEWFFPGKPGEIAGISEHIAEDIRNQYMLGYVSANPKQDGSRRTIRLVAQSPGSRRKLRVRTRRAYIAQRGAK